MKTKLQTVTVNAEIKRSIDYHVAGGSISATFTIETDSDSPENIAAARDFLTREYATMSVMLQEMSEADVKSLLVDKPRIVAESKAGAASDGSRGYVGRPAAQIAAPERRSPYQGSPPMPLDLSSTEDY